MLSKTAFLDEFLQTYRMFNFNDAAINPFYQIDADYLAENADSLKKYETGLDKLPFQSIQPPQLSKDHNGTVTVEFYAERSSTDEIHKIRVSITPDYKVEINSQVYLKNKPEIIE